MRHHDRHMVVAVYMKTAIHGFHTRHVTMGLQVAFHFVCVCPDTESCGFFVQPQGN